ncbi:hypothetical protein ACQ4LE_007587, partial [Meloidogyne hapla]
MRKLRPSFFYFSVKNVGSTLRGPVIGINFGFANSSVAILENRKAKVLKNDEGSILTPSVVAFTKDDEILVGAPAIRQSVLNSQNTIFGIKRLIGRKYDEKEVQDFMKDIPYKIVRDPNGDVLIEVQDKLHSPPQIASYILTKLKETAENNLNKKVRDAIITVPSYFNDSQKQAIKEAAKLAGLRVLRFVNESVAAAIGYNLDIQNAQNEIVAVCNLNGGIFEFSILELKNDVYEVLSNNYDASISGEAFDNAIINYFVSESKRENGIDLIQDPVAMQRLRKAAVKAKCKLSNSTQNEIILPNIIFDSRRGLLHFQIKLSRSKLEELTADLVQKIEELCKKSMKDADLKSDDISQDEIQKSFLHNEKESWDEDGNDIPYIGIGHALLVGGMSKMPKIRNVIGEVFKKEIFNSELKDGAIAIGAVYLGVLFGKINYFDDRRTPKNRSIIMTSQKMFIGERRIYKEHIMDIAKLFWEAITIIVKEYYSALHIDVRSRKAIKELGHFAVHMADERKDYGDMYSAVVDTDDISKKGIGWYFGGEHKDLCNSCFDFLKYFPSINKNEVHNKLKPYILGINLPSEEDKMAKYIAEKLEGVKFKRIKY